jgi:hypothetical protein
MLYNNAASYNSESISYQGSLRLNVPSINNSLAFNSLTLSDITVVISLNEDFTNYTTIGTVTLEYVESGIITLEVSEQQANALSQAQVVYINTDSEVSFELLASGGSFSSMEIVQVSYSGEISVS